MTTFYRAKLTLEEVEPWLDGNYRREHTATSAEIVVTGDTPADAMYQIYDHARTIHQWRDAKLAAEIEAFPPLTPTDANARIGAAFAQLPKTAQAWLLPKPTQPDAERERDLITAAPRPTIVVLCGSTRLGDAFRKANLDETLAGRIVLSIGCDMRTDADLFADRTEADMAKVKARLDELHKRKIDLADEVLVLNVGGYIGESTRSEIAYAQAQGKPIRWLEPAEQPAQPATDERPAPTAWCGDPDHDDPCERCDAILIDTAEASRERMPDADGAWKRPHAEPSDLTAPRGAE
ncbi:MAG TPA: hypothetical protein VFC19_49395 [Candidatus Limnocylindrales bacterium]|nr:hypothetical protein [Candidatus Limnocylindrales bacterium]